MRRVGGLTLAAMLALSAPFTAVAQSEIPAGDWRTINRDLAATRYSPLDEINKTNVGNLREAWSYPLKSFNTAVPIVVGGTMYVTAGYRVIALDSDTGKEVWVYEEPRPEGESSPFGGVSGRGVGYWAGDKANQPRIMVMAGSKMIALDAATGALIKNFGDNGHIDVGVPYGGTPTIYKDVAIIGAASLEDPKGPAGNPRAFNVRTGKKMWEFDTTPDEGQPYHDTWGSGTEGRGGTNMWGFAATIDTENGLAYLPIGGPAHNYYGGTRAGSNLFGNSLVAVDLQTGKYKWHFQTVHHDLWDSDMPTSGPLMKVKINGKSYPAIANVGKTSFLYILDAKTGKPLHEVKETPVPAGDVPGEYYSPTQPIPVVTPPLSRVSFSPADIVTAEDTTATHAAACRALYEKSGGYENKGPFTPFVYHKEGDAPHSSIQFPGGIGGVNWGGPAADPTTGTIFVNALDTSLVGWVEKVPDPKKPYSFDATESEAYDRASVEGKGPFFSFVAPIDGKYDDQGKPIGVTVPCYKGPWAKLTAVDVNTGKIKWAVPLGLYEELPEGKQLQGNAGSAGPSVTAGGLVFVGATNDKRFRAFDADTGAQLWEASIRGNANANPMSYRGRGGKQFVAINAGGTIVAYSLPN